MYKKLLSIAVAGVVLSLAVLPAFAQSWGTGAVLGENDEVTTETGSDTDSDEETSTDDESTTTTRESRTLRENNFEEIKAQRELKKAERQAEIEEMKALKQAERCTRVTENIQRRQDYYSNSHTESISRFQGLFISLEKVSARLTELEYDTTDLDGKIAELKAMVAELNEQQDVVTASLVQAQAMACDEDPSQFKEELKSSLEGLRAMRTEVKAIRTALREEITELLTELKANRPTKDTTDATE